MLAPNNLFLSNLEMVLGEFSPDYPIAVAMGLRALTPLSGKDAYMIDIVFGQCPPEGPPKVAGSIRGYDSSFEDRLPRAKVGNALSKSPFEARGGVAAFFLKVLEHLAKTRFSLMPVVFVAPDTLEARAFDEVLDTCTPSEPLMEWLEASFQRANLSAMPPKLREKWLKCLPRWMEVPTDVGAGYARNTLFIYWMQQGLLALQKGMRAPL